MLAVMTRPHVLYGLPHSLYTGPARAYLRKSGAAFVESFASVASDEP